MGTFAGSKLYIGTTAGSAANTLTNFIADSYVEVKNMNNMGEIGASANVVQFPLVSEDFVKKSKGTRNAGDPTVVVERVSTDPGQLLMRDAEESKYYFNFKLVIADAENEHQTDTTVYFRALVAGVPMQLGGNEDFVTETYSLAIYPRPVIVESQFITSP